MNFFPHDDDFLYLNELIRSIVTEYTNEPKKGTPNKELLYPPSEDSFYVEADRSRITQVLSNLIDNANKSIAEEGTIFINLEKKQDDYVTVTVKDTGRGIPDDILPNLFTKFSSKSLSGTGLGLFISSIIESHNGKIWGENNFLVERAELPFTLHCRLRVNQRIRNSYPILLSCEFRIEWYHIGLIYHNYVNLRSGLHLRLL